MRYGIPMGKQFDDFDSLLGESKDPVHTHSKLLSKGNFANVTFVLFLLHVRPTLYL